MYEVDDYEPPQPHAARRDVSHAKEELAQEIRELETGLVEQMHQHADSIKNAVRFYSRSVFFPALLAVIVGGYIVKYWL